MQPDFEADPQVQAATAETANIVARAANFTVSTAEQYTAAGTDLTAIKAARKRLDDLRTSITRPMDTAKKRVMDFFRGPADKLDLAERTIKRAMIGYQDEQERQRREEQARLDALARKEREKLEAQAQRAADAGKVERSEQLQERAATVVAPVVQREAPKVAGVSTREVPKFEITDPNLVPREYLMVDEKKVRAMVNAMRADTNIPGVRVWMEKQLAAGVA